MGRAPRVEFRGATYHVFSRGNRRERIFLDDEDYQEYLHHLRQTASEFDTAVLAYCLMPNHPHLCVRTEGQPLSRLMHRLNTSHARRFNQKYGLRGHLHESRYRALLVDETAYLLRLVRYIHRNPVRAGLSDSPSGWAYSSHREYLSASSWLERERVLAHFGGLGAYEAFMNQEGTQEDAEVFSAAGRGFRYAGRAQALEKVVERVREESSKPRLLWAPLGRSRLCATEEIEQHAQAWLRALPHRVALAALQGPEQHEPLRGARRALAGFLHARGYSLRSIGLLLGRNESAVSRLVGRHQGRQA